MTQPTIIPAQQVNKITVLKNLQHVLASLLGLQQQYGQHKQIQYANIHTRVIFMFYILMPELRRRERL
jgi:hypothetical protein